MADAMLSALVSGKPESAVEIFKRYQNNKETPQAIRLLAATAMGRLRR